MMHCVPLIDTIEQSVIVGLLYIPEGRKVPFRVSRALKRAIVFTEGQPRS